MTEAAEVFLEDCLAVALAVELQGATVATVTLSSMDALSTECVSNANTLSIGETTISNLDTTWFSV